MIVGATTLAGAACTLFSLVAGADRRPDGLAWTVAAVLALLATASWSFPVVLRRRGRPFVVTLDEGFFVVAALSLPQRVTAVVFAVMVIGASVLRRRPLDRSLFDWGRVMVAVTLGLGVSHAVGGHGTTAAPANVAGALLGAAVYFATFSGLGGAAAAASGLGWSRAVNDRLLLRGLTSLGAVVVGTAVAVDLTVQPSACALIVPLAILVRLVVVAQLATEDDRSRTKVLLELTTEVNRATSGSSVIDSVLRVTAERLRAEATLVPVGRTIADQLVAPIEIEGRTQWLAVSGRGPDEQFTTSDRLLLEAIAAVAKSALVNAELHREVRFERRRLASVTRNIAEGVCAIDADGNLTFANPAAAALVRLPGRHGLIGDQVSRDTMRAPEFLLAPARSAMTAGKRVREDEAYFDAVDGEPLLVAYTAVPVREEGKVVGAVITFRDITEQKEMEAAIARQAFQDSLTGLANRRVLVERLEAVIAPGAAPGLHALIFVDVDRFKSINDSLGHGTGDGLLVAVANRLRQIAGSDWLVARFGGDEFVVLVEGVGSAEGAVAAAERICESMSVPLVLADGYELVAGVSVGVALASPGRSADDVLRDADVAMYAAKREGGSYRLFDQAVMGTRSSERIDLESALRRAVEREELLVYYQPQFSLDDNRILGAEALVRWRQPGGEIVLPDRFIPVAEETGLILPIGRFVLESACAQIQALQSDPGVELPISVNLSPRQFQQSSLVSDVAAVLEQAGVRPDLLKFEITETMVMADRAGATEIMKKLERLGVQLAIDDFGTGHASLGYLKSFPVQELKIDRAFVENVVDDRVDAAIVRAMVSLAEAVGIESVAEGIETLEQLQALRAVGCRVGQGYVFSRPLPAEAFLDLVRRSSDALRDEAGTRSRPRLRAL